MKGIYKTGFDQVKLQKLSEVLQDENIQAKWKSSRKTEVQNPAEANRLVLEQNGKWFFKQNRKRGYIRLTYLDETTKNKLLKNLTEQQLYTKPDWMTSWFIFVIFLIVGLFSFGIKGMWILLFNGILQFVIVSRIASRKKVNYTFYRISFCVGLVGVCIPILVAIIYFFSTLVEMLIYTKKQFSSMYPMFNYEHYFMGMLWVIPFTLVIGILPIPLIKAYHQDYLYRKLKPLLKQEQESIDLKGPAKKIPEQRVN